MTLAALTLALTVSAAHAAPPTSPQPKHLTLDQAIELGIENATLVLKAETQREVTGADLLAAYGRFLPNLAATANYGYTNGQTFGSPTSGTQTTGTGAAAGIANSTYRQAGFTVSSSINLFDGFGDVAAVRAANARDEASKLTFERAKQQIAIDIAQAFLQVYLDDQISAIDEQNLKVSQEREKLIRAKRNVGSANDADLFRQEAETAQDETTLLDAKQRAHVDLLKLLQKLESTREKTT